MEIHISENIRKLRKDRGLTQEQLAEVLDVTVGAVSKWELGASVPDINLIVEMAEFFETSVDVLLGYEWHSGTMGESLQKIKDCKCSKDYEKGRKVAEKALKQYPNCFEIVYQSACLFSVMGMELKKSKYSQRALELFERASELIEQNTDPTIFDCTIQNAIANILITLGKTEEGIRRLKQYNYDGISNDLIGFTLAAVCRKQEEALLYLSESLIDCVSKLFRVCIGYVNVFGDKKDYVSAVQMLLWMQGIVHGLKQESKISFLDKAEALLLTVCAGLFAEQGNDSGMRKYLQEAIEIAKAFDDAPDYGMSNVKFYYGKKDAVAFDDFGSTALEGVQNLLLEEWDNPEAIKILQEEWERLRYENR